VTADERALAAWEAGANLPRRSYTRPLPQPVAPPKPEPKPAAEFLTVEEAAARIGVSKMTLYRAIGEDRTLRAYKFRRSYRIHEQDWAAYLTSCMVEDVDR
jgi:excisionase family DNA binding protein